MTIADFFFGNIFINYISFKTTKNYMTFKDALGFDKKISLKKLCDYRVPGKLRRTCKDSIQ